MNVKTVARVSLMVALVAAVVVSITLFDARARLADFLAWVQSIGPWGPVVLGAFYIPACLLFLPGSIITMGAGFAFGIVQGTIAVSIGSTLGATAAFIVGRTMARGLIEGKVSANPRFRAIDQAVGRQGFMIVLLTRLSPVFPFNLLNYAFGLTKVSLRHYVLASWIGMFPGTVMYVYLGSLVKNLADLASGQQDRGPAEWALYAVGLVATIAVTVLITRVARRALKEAVSEHENEDDSHSATPPGEPHVGDVASRA